MHPEQVGRFRTGSWARSLAASAIVLSCVYGFSTVGASGAEAEPEGRPDLYFSTSTDRTDLVPLWDADVAGPVYIGVDGDLDDVKSVSFWLDDAQGDPDRTELAYPFDLAGGDRQGNAIPLDSDKLAAGAHTAYARIKFKDGSVRSVFARFTTAGRATA